MSYGDSLKISIVIITYNRPDDMLELANNIIGLQEKEKYLEEIIIVNNNSSADYNEVEKIIDQHSEIPFRYYYQKENLGVSRGRNYAMQQAKSEILLFIDDDALFENTDVLKQVHVIFSDAANEKLGALAVRIFYQSTNDFQKNAFPHKNFEELKNKDSFDTYYFSGCAHAIKKSVINNVGYYPEDFFYGMEEYDLSYRIINAGYKIAYSNKITILHKESPLGRITNENKLRGMWVNKTKVAWKYLPKKYFYSTAIMWSMEYIRKISFHINNWRKGWQEIFSISSSEKRNLLQKPALDYLKKVKARLWY